LTTGVPFCHPSHAVLEGALRVVVARQEGERRVHRKLDGHGDGANPAGAQDAPRVPEVVRSSPARHSKDQPGVSVIKPFTSVICECLYLS
jgi:hypothetical protein